MSSSSAPVAAKVATWALLLGAALNGQAAGAERDRLLQAAKSWGYQLQKVEPAEIAASPYDMVVIDYSRDGSDETAFTREDVARMQKKPDGGRRIVLSYLSIGEAETYRYYWRWYWRWYWGWFFSPAGPRLVGRAESGMARQLCGSLLDERLAGHHIQGTEQLSGSHHQGWIRRRLSRQGRRI
jgi:hypothetical protein